MLSVGYSNRGLSPNAQWEPERSSANTKSTIKSSREIEQQSNSEEIEIPATSIKIKNVTLDPTNWIRYLYSDYSKRAIDW